MKLVAVLGAGLIVLASCGGTSSNPSPSPSPSPVPASVTKSAGDAQVTLPGGAVPVPPTVVVTDGAGHPVAGVRVDFAVTGGGGAAWCPPATTDAAGSASCAHWTLGTAREANTLAATVSGLPPAVFTAALRADVLLDLGHGAAISLLELDGSRLLSMDTSRHWVLWDAATCAQVASGDTPCIESSAAPHVVDLAGSSVLVASPCGFEVRDAADGHVVSRTLGAYAWTRLAADGSYVYAGTAQGLSAWSRDGAPRFTRAGDYSQANTYAAADALRVAGGPAGADVIETVDPVTGTSSVGPAFQGTFHSWFADGQRFFTNLSTTVWVYGSASTQEAIFSLPTIENLAGQGAWLWTHPESTSGYPLTVYRVDGGGAAAETYALGYGAKVFQGGGSIGVALYGQPKVAIIDLSGAAPSWTDHALPVAYPSALAAASSGRWFVGNKNGVILDGETASGSPRYCGLGAAWSVAGGGDRLAVATASGEILLVDAPTGTVEGGIAFPSSKLRLSSDGAVLAAAAETIDDQYMPDRTLKVFALPAGTELRSVPYTFGVYPTPRDFSLSASGSHLAEVLGTFNSPNWTCDRRVSPVAGGAPTWTVPTSSCDGTPILLSPAGNLVAFSSGNRSPTSVTNVYRDGALATAVPGYGVGWIDDGRLLVNEFVTKHLAPAAYAGARIYDPSGALLAEPALEWISSFQTVTASSVYSPGWNAIVSLDTGAVLWTGPSVPLGAVAGGRVVYPVNYRVLSEAY